MKINEVISAADSIVKNAFLPKEKAGTVLKLEERLRKEYCGEEVTLTYPDAEGEELFLPNRYTEIYIYYLVAMIYFWQRDFDEYNNFIGLYSAVVEDFKADFAQEGKKAPDHFSNLFG